MLRENHCDTYFKYSGMPNVCYSIILTCFDVPSDTCFESLTPSDRTS